MDQASAIKQHHVSTGPTNHQLNQQRRFFCADGGRQHGAEKILPSAPQTSSASLFSFNSYQDLTPVTLSTFSAFKLNEGELHESGRPQVNPCSPPQLNNCRPNPRFNSKFRVHSRHRSGSGWQPAESNLLSSEPATSVGKLARHVPSIGVWEPKQQHRCHLREPVKRSQHCIEQVGEVGSKQESRQDYGMNMSQTVQSIHSLSMQLNQAASLPSSSQNSLSGARSMAQQVGGEQPGASFLANSSNKISRLVSKKAGRVKEILLQNLGKADKTSDELFSLYEDNFYKQQAQATKLQKEFKNYVNSLKGSHEASKSLNDCIQQTTSDYQSARHDLVCENLSQLAQLQDDLLEKLREQLLISMGEYLAQFNELREKIAKRRRKLIDFDSSRRIYELTLANVNKRRQQTGGLRPSLSSSFLRSLHPQHTADPVQTATNQLVDEARLLKLREQYNYCKIMFETINSELHEELPLVCDKKMRHLLMSLQNYFSLSAQFHSNASKLYVTAGDVIDELPIGLHSRRQVGGSSSNQSADEFGADSQVGKVAPPTSGSSGVGSSRADSSSSASSPDNSSTNEDQVPMDEEPASFEQVPADEEEDEQVEGESGNELALAEPEVQVAVEPAAVCSAGAAVVSVTVAEPDSVSEAGSRLEHTGGEHQVTVSVESEPKKPAEEMKQELEKPVAASADTEAPAASEGFLYKVRTSFKYLAEDVDELCFEPDEIIQVVEFDKSQEQEEGWLMGIREVNGQRGLFPANFTRLI